MIRENQLGSLLFVLVLTLGFGPLLWGDWMVNHDNFNGFLPYRHFASVQLRQGLFPFWNPWINLGYPFASDPQSGAWYPVVWILSSLSVYTPRMLAIEWVIHVWIAGLGVVWWFRKGFQLSSDVSWISGLTYAMCGFFTGTAQILPFVIAGAWVPWVLGSFHLSVQRPRLSTTLILAVSMAMLVLGGYPSFALTLGWVLLAWGIVHCWSLRAQRARLKDFVVAVVTSGTVSLLLCAGFLAGFVQDAPLTSRIDPEIVSALDQGVWSPWCWFSLLVPTAQSLPVEWIRTDGSHVNGFVGWIPLLVLVWGWKHLRPKERWLGLGLISFSVLMALGRQGGVHTVVSEIVPGFNMFRHTAQFRLYAILLTLVGAGIAMHRQSAQPRSRNLLLFALGLAVILAVAALAQGERFEMSTLWHWSPRDAVHVTDSVWPLAGNWALTVVLVLIGATIWAWLKPEHDRKNILVVQSVMMLLGTWAVFGSTVAKRGNPQELEGQFRSLAEAPWAGHQTLIEEMGNHPELNVWRNAPMVLKHASHQGYNPFQLSWYRDIAKTERFASFHKHPSMWISNPDTLWEAEITRFEPELVSVDVSCARKGFSHLVWAQNFHPRWEVVVDGQSSEVEFWEDGFMATEVECSSSPITVNWRYVPGHLKWLGWLAGASWLLTLAMLCQTTVVERNSGHEKRRLV